MSDIFLYMQRFKYKLQYFCGNQIEYERSYRANNIITNQLATNRFGLSRMKH